MTGRAGFALVAALWLLVALSAISLDFVLRERGRRLTVIHRVEAARAEALADAGVEHAQALMTRRVRESPLPVAGPLDPWREPERLQPRERGVGEEGSYVIRFRDAGSLLHLNRVDEAGFRRFLEALAVDAGLADRLAQEFADWRDRDQLRRARGGEREDYLASGAPVLPPDRDVGHPAALRHLASMTDVVFRRIEPLLTVSGTGRVNLASAPVPVLRSLPGLSEALVSEILTRRSRGTLPGSVAELGVDLPPGERAALERHLPELLSRTTTEVREVIVESEGRPRGAGFPRTVEAVLVRTSGGAILVDRRVRP